MVPKASPRRRTNQLVTIAEQGTEPVPAMTPLLTAQDSRNSHRLFTCAGSGGGTHASFREASELKSGVKGYGVLGVMVSAHQDAVAVTGFED